MTIVAAVNAATLGGCAGRSAGSPAAAVGVSPAAVAEELLAADRAFAAASRRTDVAGGMAAMLADDAVMPIAGGFAVGRDSVLAVIRGDTTLAGARLDWTPLRVGVSADGRHGFSLGYTSVQGADGTATPGKYLTYWVKRADGWRAAVYRRRRATTAAEAGTIPPALPGRGAAPSQDPAVLTGYRESLARAERSFSDDAQRIGLGAAFARWGSPDAMNMGPSTRSTFVIGADSIGAMVADGEPATGSSVSWAPDHGVLVASSGDLGVTMGTIVVNEPDSTGARRRFSFFTVWRRPTPDQPWRYVAE